MEVEKYEEQFAHRFSEQDEEFQEYLQHPAVPPPIVEAWRSRDNRYQDRRPQWGRGGGGGGGWGQRSYGQRSYGQRSHPYNSYNQRPHHDRY